MRWWHFLGIFFLIPVVWVCYMAIKYNNPYKLIMLFGKKGAGKTTTLAMLATKYSRKGWTVFSTVRIPGTFHIQPSDVGEVQFPPRSVLLLDEVGMYYDNRDYKSFKPSVRDYFKLQRHYKHRVYMFSQTFDVDVKLRNLTDHMYMLVNYFGFLTVCKQIKRKLVVVQPTGDSEGRIADGYFITPFFLTPFGARMFVYIPHWVKLFDSYEAPVLTIREYDKIEYPDGMYVTKRGRVRVSKQARSSDVA